MIKLKDLMTGLLNEVGEGSSKPYGYKKTVSNPKEPEWEFTTDSGVEYTVVIEKFKLKAAGDYLGGAGPVGQWDIQFYINPRSVGDRRAHSHTTVVDRGELYRVMATVVSIVKDEMKAGEPDVLSWAVRDPKRKALFNQYIRKAFPGGEIVSRMAGYGDEYMHIKLKP